MKKENIFALNTTIFITILVVFCSFLTQFLFGNINSIFEFFLNIKKEFLENPQKFLNAFLILIITSFCVYISLYFIGKKFFPKLDVYNQSLKDYNHYLAHELKTPISVIFSDLEVLKYGFDKKIIENSQNQLKNMINIIDVLLSFSESLNISERENINIENFLKSYINTYFSTQKQKIFIENKEFNLSVETNQILFRRVIRNLIENALKYSLDGEVFIKIQNQKIIFENSIKNTFSNQEIQKLFTKFYRLDKGKKGYGLGLSLIKEILKFLGFGFKIYSKQNKFFAEISLEK
ncbi:HAMP domain-containing histidine kinase [Candidatus Gracilibacteria bacterium]|nr:HAMP domain-containing histidine kinase [Candidatus Gracilibacteria bacterium]